MFGRFLGRYTIYSFSGALAPCRNFARFKIHFASKSCVLLYWQRYCTALQQRVSAKLYGVVQGMELRNFRRGCHQYSAGRPSRWASAHITSRGGRESNSQPSSRESNALTTRLPRAVSLKSLMYVTSKSDSKRQQPVLTTVTGV